MRGSVERDGAEPPVVVHPLRRVRRRSRRGVRATKFHHMTMGSPSGTPPMRSAVADAPVASRGSSSCRLPGSRGGPGSTRRPSIVTAPASTTSACSQSGRSGRVDRPGRRASSAPTSAVSCRAAEVVPPSSPTSTVAVPDSSSNLRELGVVLEAGLAVPGGLGLRDPQLDAVQVAAVAPGPLLAVGHPVTGRHEVELARTDRLLGAEAVAVEDLPGDEPRHGLQPGVGVRADVDAALLRHGRRVPCGRRSTRRRRFVGHGSEGPDGR